MISSLIKTWLAPYEVYLWAAVAVLSLVLGVTFVAHERAIGENKVKAADAKAVAIQNKLNAKVEADAQTILNPADSQLHAALDAPPPVNAVTLRVCPSPPTRSGRPIVSANAGPGSSSAVQQTGFVREPVAPVSEGQGVDVGPTTIQLLAQADAELAYWRKYYADCVTHKICKPAEIPHAQ